MIINYKYSVFSQQGVNNNDTILDCRPLQSIHARPKWVRVNMAYSPQLTKNRKKILYSNNHVHDDLWLCGDDINYWVKDSKKIGFLIDKLIECVALVGDGWNKHSSRRDFCIGGCRILTPTIWGTVTMLWFEDNAKHFHSSLTYPCSNQPQCS